MENIPECSYGKPRSSSPLSTIRPEEERQLLTDVHAAFLSRQPWIRDAGIVRHRLRGILLTHDTYDMFRLSFDSGYDSQLFLGRLLGAMSSTEIIRMTEIQLDELNRNWNEEERGSNPQFLPVDLPVLVCMRISYSISTQWDVMKTLHYLAISQDLLETLSEDAHISVSLNALTDAQHQSLVSQVPYLRPSELQFCPELDLQKAVQGDGPQVRKGDDSGNLDTVPGLIEDLINMIEVGRREQAEPFLIVHEITIQRDLQRDSMESLPRAMKFLYFSNSENDNPLSKASSMRVFLTRRLVGSIARSNLDVALAKGLKEAAHVNPVASGGELTVLELDRDAENLLRRAKVECCPERTTDHDSLRCLSLGITKTMFMREKWTATTTV